MNFTSLKAYMEERKQDFVPSHTNPTWEESEDKIWAVQEYLSSCGTFTDEDRAFLREYDPELLDLEEDEEEEDEEGEDTPASAYEEPPIRTILKVDELGHINAIFPDIPWSTKGGDYCTAVTKEEGHGECCREWVEEQADLPPERLDEARQMLKELGYYSVEIVTDW